MKRDAELLFGPETEQRQINAETFLSAQQFAGATPCLVAEAARLHAALARRVAADAHVEAEAACRVATAARAGAEDALKRVEQVRQQLERRGAQVGRLTRLLAPDELLRGD